MLLNKHFLTYFPKSSKHIKERRKRELMRQGKDSLGKRKKNSRQERSGTKLPHPYHFWFSLAFSLIDREIPLTSNQSNKQVISRKRGKKDACCDCIGGKDLIPAICLPPSYEKERNMDDEVVQRVFQDGGRDYFQQQPSTSASSSSSSILQSLPLHVVRKHAQTHPKVHEHVVLGLLCFSWNWVSWMDYMRG